MPKAIFSYAVCWEYLFAPWRYFHLKNSSVEPFLPCVSSILYSIPKPFTLRAKNDGFSCTHYHFCRQAMDGFKQFALFEGMVSIKCTLSSLKHICNLCRKKIHTSSSLFFFGRSGGLVIAYHNHLVCPLE